MDCKAAYRGGIYYQADSAFSSKYITTTYFHGCTGTNGRNIYTFTKGYSSYSITDTNTCYRLDSGGSDIYIVYYQSGFWSDTQKSTTASLTQKTYLPLYVTADPSTSPAIGPLCMHASITACRTIYEAVYAGNLYGLSTYAIKLKAGNPHLECNSTEFPGKTVTIEPESEWCFFSY